MLTRHRFVDRKVRDHDHFMEEFRGAAHNTCNLRIHNRKIIPVIVNNLSKYNLKLFIRFNEIY